MPVTPTPERTPHLYRGIDVEWSGPQKCHWRGCASKATFRSPGSLKAHIRNIHVTPLVCTYPNCSYKKPFGKPCDLKRRMANIHNTERGYPCLESNCQEVFTRRDKMMRHVKEKHELFKCSYNHCSATVFATQKESHLRESHDRFECAIGSCALGYKSFFTLENLKRHMRTSHRMTNDPVSTITSHLTKGAKEDGVLYANCPLRPTYRDCGSCLAGSNEQ